MFSNLYRQINRKLSKALDFIPYNLAFIETCDPLIVANGDIQCDVIPAIMGEHCQVVCDTGYASSAATVMCGYGHMWADNPTCIGKTYIGIASVSRCIDVINA